MKRLIIVCEGPTEHEFCVNVLAPELLKNNIYIEAPLVKKSNGGIVSWSSIKRQIEMHLHEKDAYVSLLVDYYGIKDSYAFPGWNESKNITSKKDKLQFLCDCMKADIVEELASRFIPYLQIHEFESLLFSDIDVFRSNFDDHEMDFSKLESAIREFSNPEDINSNPNLAPSKRLIEAISGYEKVVYGSCLAEEIGLESIVEKCPLFSQWFFTLRSI
ncbi:MAG: DUF4276 family protein [Muribaculaceae bacterium]|nr:DUF4276 family protein [Muribaculaceae bacterium]MDE6553616.1 DUF4276 family protein [Muribaculaceae bacterium]